jgi:hypothetical protein
LKYHNIKNTPVLLIDVLESLSANNRTTILDKMSEISSIQSISFSVLKGKEVQGVRYDNSFR